MTGRHLPRVGNFPGRSTLKGSLRLGHNTGIPDTISVGEAVFTQRADVSAAETSATTLFVLPSDNEGGATLSDIIRFDIVVDVAFEASADGAIELFLASAGGSLLGSVDVSGDGQYGILPGGTVNLNGTITADASASAIEWYAAPGQPIVGLVSATGTPPDTGHAFITMHYVPR